MVPYLLGLPAPDYGEIGFILQRLGLLCIGILTLVVACIWLLPKLTRWMLGKVGRDHRSERSVLFEGLVYLVLAVLALVPYALLIWMSAQYGTWFIYGGYGLLLAVSHFACIVLMHTSGGTIVCRRCSYDADLYDSELHTCPGCGKHFTSVWSRRLGVYRVAPTLAGMLCMTHLIAMISGPFLAMFNLAGLPFARG